MCAGACVCGCMRLEQTLGTRFCALKILLLLLLRSQTKKYNRSWSRGWDCVGVAGSGNFWADICRFKDSWQCFESFTKLCLTV